MLPLYGLCIGVIDQAQKPPLRPRVPRDLCFFENSYPEAFAPQDLERAYAAMSVKRDWFLALSSYFTTGGTMQKSEPIMAREGAHAGRAPAGVGGRSRFANVGDGPPVGRRGAPRRAPAGGMCAIGLC